MDQNFSKKSREWKIAFGKLIQNRLDELKMTQKHLSYVSGMNIHYLNRVVKGVHSLGGRVFNAQLVRVREELSLSDIEDSVQAILASSESCASAVSLNEEMACLVGDILESKNDAFVIAIAMRYPRFIHIIVPCIRDTSLEVLEDIGFKIFPFDGNTTTDLLEAKEWFWGYYFERKSALSKKTESELGME